MVERVRVGEMLRLERRAVPIDPLEEYRLIGVYSFGKGIFHRDPAPGSSLGDYKFFAIQPDDLVLSNIQAWEGAIGHATPGDAGTIGTHRFLTYVPTDDRIDTNWARWFFLSEPGHALIRQAAPGTVMRNRTLAIERFEALEIPLPPLDEQQRVATRLDGLAAASQQAQCLAERSKAIATALRGSIAARPDVSGSEKAARGWSQVVLGDVMQPNADVVSVDPMERYPNIGIFSFGRGVFEKAPIEGSRTSAKTLNRVKAGQFIYSRLFAFEGAYGHVPPRFDGFFVSNEFPTFEADPDRLDAHWLASYLRSPDRWAELRGSSKGLGLRRQRVPAEALLRYPVMLPPTEDQRRSVEAFEQLDVIENKRDATTRRSAALVPAALNEAFGGLA